MPPLCLPIRSLKIVGTANVSASTDNPILPIEDLEEAVWTYVQTMREPKSAMDFAAQRFGAFKTLTSWKRRVMRLLAKDGTCTMTVAEDEESLKASTNYELTRLVDVKWLFIPESESLSFGATAAAFAGGIRDKPASGDDEGDSFSNVGFAMPTYQYVFGQIAFSILFLNSKYAKAYDACGDDRVAVDKLLGQPEVCTVVSVAFGSTTEAESWFEWFSEFILLRERAIVETKETDGVSIFSQDRGVGGGLLEANRLLNSVPTYQLTPSNVRSLKEYVHFFLKSGPRTAGGLASRFLWGTNGPPNEGRTRCKAPNSDEYHSVSLKGNFETAELFFGKGHKSSIMRAVTPVKYTRRIVLNQQCRIFATSAFGTEFVIDMTPITSYGPAAGPHSSSHGHAPTMLSIADHKGHDSSDVNVGAITSSVNGSFAAATPYSTSSGTNIITTNDYQPTEHQNKITFSRNAWYFLCKSVKLRNSFIEYLRLIKGKGTKAQTEEETYPFTISAKEDFEAMVAASGFAAVATLGLGNTEGNFMFKGLGAKKRFSVDSSAYDDGSHDGDETRSHNGEVNELGAAGATNTLLSRKKVGFNSKVVATNVDEEKQKREEEEYLALYPSHEPSSRGSSVESGSSCRAFRYFPTYFDVTTIPYVDSQLAYHLQGRSSAILRRIYPPGQVPPNLFAGPGAPPTIGQPDSQRNANGNPGGINRRDTNTTSPGLRLPNQGPLTPLARLKQHQLQAMQVKERALHTSQEEDPRKMSRRGGGAAGLLSKGTPVALVGAEAMERLKRTTPSRSLRNDRHNTSPSRELYKVPSPSTTTPARSNSTHATNSKVHHTRHSTTPQRAVFAMPAGFFSTPLPLTDASARVAAAIDFRSRNDGFDAYIYGGGSEGGNVGSQSTGMGGYRDSYGGDADLSEGGPSSRASHLSRAPTSTREEILKNMLRQKLGGGGDGATATVRSHSARKGPPPIPTPLLSASYALRSPTIRRGITSPVSPTSGNSVNTKRFDEAFGAPAASSIDTRPRGTPVRVAARQRANAILATATKSPVRRPMR